MREIKFRAWDKENKYWLKPSSPRIPVNIFEFDSLGNMTIGSSDALVIQQYTGLKDKNGKEIYEGDIVRDKWKSGVDADDSVGVVTWSDEFAGWALKDEVGIFHLNHHSELKKKHEIIGNIYENKELLK